MCVCVCVCRCDCESFVMIMRPGRDPPRGDPGRNLHQVKGDVDLVLPYTQFNHSERK